MDLNHQEEVLKNGVWAALERRNISRRDFLRFCSIMTGALALPARYTPRIVKALEQMRQPALIWRQFQDCTGNSESAIRAAHPAFADIVTRYRSSVICITPAFSASCESLVILDALAVTSL